MLDSIIVGKQIADLRKKSGLTQEYLAEKLDITAQAISKWENGHSLPETMHLPSLARLFNCSIDAILLPFAEQDKAFHDFVKTIDSAYSKFALSLYQRLKENFAFTIDYKDNNAIFNNNKKEDFIIQIAVESKTSGNSNIAARLPLQNCSNYISMINDMPEYVKQSFRINDCKSCQSNKCPSVMVYTFEGIDYRQCHFITLPLNSAENAEHIFALLSAEHGYTHG